MYNGNVFIMRINKQVPDFMVHRLLMDEINNKVSFEENYINNFVDKCILKQSPLGTKMTCSQYALYVLHFFGVVRENDNTCITPHDFVNMKTINGYKYGDLIRIK